MVELCTCLMPFCDNEHAPLDFSVPVEQPDDLDDWEGPMRPEYNERDEEAYLEMVRDDLMIGAFGL